MSPIEYAGYGEVETYWSFADWPKWIWKNNNIAQSCHNKFETRKKSEWMGFSSVGFVD